MRLWGTGEFTIYGSDYAEGTNMNIAYAEDYCVTQFGHLASAHSQADADTFESLITGNTAWIGYHDMGFEAGCTDDRHQGIGGEIMATSFAGTPLATIPDVSSETPIDQSRDRGHDHDDHRKRRGLLDAHDLDQHQHVRQ